jgi:DNA-binding beta-propeller fold protein YncE
LKLNAKKTLSSALTLMVAASLAISACGGPDAPITVSGVPTIKGQNASFDNVEIDQAAHRLYLGDRTDKGIDVFDISKPPAKYLQTIALPSSPNGLAFAPDLSRLFVGTAAGSVVVVDTRTGSIVGDVPTGKASADLLDYGSARQRLYVANSTDGTITSIDPSTLAIKSHFDVGYQLEQPRYNPKDGMVYVTSPQADALFKIDPSSGKVAYIYSLGGCQPTGLAINPSSNKALIVCGTFVMSWDLSTGKSETFKQVLGGDIVNYNAKVDRFFVGSPHITKPSVIGIFGGNPIAYYTSVDTGAHGNSATFDETNNIVYTPDTGPKSPGVASFRLPDKPLILPPWVSTLTTIGMVAALVGVFGLLFFFVMRSADPARRPIPKPKPEPAAESPLAAERSRRGSRAGPA